VTAKQPITIVVGQLGSVICQGLLQILVEDPGLWVVAADLDRAALELAVSRGDAHVAILDEDTAITPSVAARLSAGPSRVGLVVLAHRPTRAYAVRTLALGVAACVSTDSPAPEIRRAVHLAADGGRALFSLSARPSHARMLGGISSLTQSERAVLDLLGVGRKNAEIARALHVSVETVRTHAKHIYRKLGVSSRGELIDISPIFSPEDHPPGNGTPRPGPVEIPESGLGQD
jgi:DNA-binding NarL/FixJ family response regulator